ncbi:MAG: DUF192 domain-containing protein [Burkholderiales bacterium]|jgi:uncharacterized membrane protein (UPF0127 family)|nr:DUF192 domain-containing protein [Burkholderiales bacterium]
MSRSVVFALVTLALAWTLLIPGVPAAAQALEKLVIQTASGPRAFDVEVMRTDDERAKGLMNRRYLPAERGMLFDFKVDQPVSMWMMNTYIPLDMLFIRKDGTIARIAEMTEPLSTRTIASGESVVGVLEINGGLSAKLGIKAGDKVQHAIFGTR